MSTPLTTTVTLDNGEKFSDYDFVGFSVRPTGSGPWRNPSFFPMSLFNQAIAVEIDWSNPTVTRYNQFTWKSDTTIQIFNSGVDVDVRVYGVKG